MKRHAVSHDNDRGVKRKSLLAAHKNGRVSQACKTCAASKLKCDEQKPCRRCRTKKLVCDWPQESRGGESSPEQPQMRGMLGIT